MGGGDSHGGFLDELREFCQQEGILWPAGIEKRLGYYLTGVDWFLYWMAGLLGKKLLKEERRLGWLMAVMFALGDEISEGNEREQADIKTTVLDNQKETQSSEERIIGFVYQQLLDKHPDLHTFEKYLKSGLKAQDDSLLQKDPHLSPAQLRKITFDKCGYAFLLLRSSISSPIGEPEIETIYQLGGLIQLINDTFDVYEDCQAGIRTLPNTASDILQFRSEFEQVVADVLNSVQAPPKRKKRFALQLAPIVATTRVCLWQFAELQARSGGVFKPEAYGRADLICDMEKPANLWRTVKFLDENRFYFKPQNR
jgi:hypothetical protein